MNRAERLTIAVTGSALFMVVLDNLIVASTLPAIQRSLHTSLSSLEWVLNAYILAFAVLMLTAAALGERYGRRRVFTAGVALFTLSSAAGALAPNAGTLIAARAVEGIGGAVIMPLTLTMMTAAFPAERRGAALGIWSAISGAGVALGPVAGGVLTDTLSWHWIFWVNVPIGIAVALAGPRVLAEGRGVRERLDLTGVVLVSAGLLGVVYATVRAGALGWTSTATLTAYAAGAALLGAFLWWERRSAHPMVPLRLFRSRAFLSANVANFLLAFAMFAGFLMLIQFFAHARGEGALTVGLHTLFWTAMPMFVAPYAGRLGRRVAPAAVASAGLLLVAGGMLLLGLVESPGHDGARAGAGDGRDRRRHRPRHPQHRRRGARRRAAGRHRQGVRDPQHLAAGRQRRRRVGRARDLRGDRGQRGRRRGERRQRRAVRAAAAAAAGALAAGARLPALAPLPAPAVG